MSIFTLTVIDTSGIQPYVFGSNNLRQIAAASALVDRATHDWSYDALRDRGKTNLRQDGTPDPDLNIENPAHGLVAELIYAGGGNTVILFKDLGDARRFTYDLTRKAAIEAPGLRLVITHTQFTWEAASPTLAQVVEHTIRKVNSKKADAALSMPLLGLGVTADCQYTGLPATTMIREPGPTRSWLRVSSEVQRKHEFWDDADRRLRRLIRPETESTTGSAALQNQLGYIYNFDEFGTKGESSYIAVVHTDGNGMGKRVQAIAQAALQEGHRKYINDIREFSAAVERKAQTALRATVDSLLAARDSNGTIARKLTIDLKKLPFRPIVFGGDDLTFVCEGRLGLALATIYLRHIITGPLSPALPADAGRALSMRAGIAVVPSHFPFARAYELAEQLADSAKQEIKRWNSQHPEGPEVSALDWHFAVSGLVLDLDEVREREYTRTGHPNDRLNMRPVLLEQSPGAGWRTWPQFMQILNEFRGPNWSGRRNKLKALRDALRAGDHATRQFVRAYEPHRLPSIPGWPETAETGWTGDAERCDSGQTCTCFDAVEALDFYLPLDPVTAQSVPATTTTGATT